MAYEPKTWSCGETITADALNHIEQGIAESGGGDAGYECIERSRQTLTEESVTTEQGDGWTYAVHALSYNTLIDADTLIVTLNGTEYICGKQVVNPYNFYGGFSENGPDFSECPFAIASSPNGSAGTNTLFTETEGTYSIKIEVVDMTVETTPCFSEAVRSVLAKNGGDGFYLVSFGHDGESADKTVEQVADAYDHKKTIIGLYGYNSAMMEAIETEMGMRNYCFGFMNWINNQLQYTRITLRFNDTVQKMTKIITTEDA